MEVERKILEICNNHELLDDQKKTELEQYDLNAKTLNGTNSEGFTPLMLLASHGNIESVELILSKEVNIFFKNNEQKDALEIAFESGENEIAKLLAIKMAMIEKLIDPAHIDNDDLIAYQLLVQIMQYAQKNQGEININVKRYLFGLDQKFEALDKYDSFKKCLLKLTGELDFSSGHFITPDFANPASSLKIDGDDSSDEEEIEVRKKTLGLKARWQNFKKSQMPSFVSSTDPEGYSFLASGLSQELLYSDEVQKEYYGKKKITLPPIEISKEEEISIFNWAKSSIEELIITGLGERAQLPQIQIRQLIRANYLSKHKDFIHMQITTLLLNKRTVFKQLNVERLQPKIIQFILEVKKDLKEFVDEISIDSEMLDDLPRFKASKVKWEIKEFVREQLLPWGILNPNDKFKPRDQRIRPQNMTPFQEQLWNHTWNHTDGRTSWNTYNSPYETVFIHFIQRESDRDQDSIIQRDARGYFFKKSVDGRAFRLSISHFLDRFKIEF